MMHSARPVPDPIHVNHRFIWWQLFALLPLNPEVSHKIICSSGDPELTDLSNIDVVTKIHGLRDDSGYRILRIARWVYGDRKGEIYAGCKRDREHPESWTWGPNGDPTGWCAYTLCPRLWRCSLDGEDTFSVQIAR